MKKRQVVIIGAGASGLMAAIIAARNGAAVTVLEPVLDYLVELRRTFNLPDELVNVLLKAVGIALTAELSAAVCMDAGSASLGKVLQILGGALVLSLSIPMFRTLMTIIKELIVGI